MCGLEMVPSWLKSLEPSPALAERTRKENSVETILGQLASVENLLCTGRYQMLLEITVFICGTKTLSVPAASLSFLNFG